MSVIRYDNTAIVRGSPGPPSIRAKGILSRMSQATMTCRGCGTKIPLVGIVCPHCQRDKRAQRAEEDVIALWCICGGILGLVVGLVVGGFGAVFLGIVGGGIVGGAACLFAGASGVPSPSTPPSVRVEAEVAPPLAVQARPMDVEARLAIVQTLRDKGLITEAELSLKRRSILDDV